MGFISRNYRRPTFMWTYAALSWLVIIVGCGPLNSNDLVVTLNTTIGNLEYGDMVEFLCSYTMEKKATVLTLIATSKNDMKELGSLTCSLLGNEAKRTGVFELLSPKDDALCRINRDLAGLPKSISITLSRKDPLPELEVTCMLQLWDDIQSSNSPCSVVRRNHTPTAADTVSISYSPGIGLAVPVIFLILIATVVCKRYPRCRNCVRSLQPRKNEGKTDTESVSSERDRDRPEANPLLSAKRERGIRETKSLRPGGLGGWCVAMDINQLRDKFDTPNSKLAEKMTPKEIMYALTSLRVLCKLEDTDFEQIYQLLRNEETTTEAALSLLKIVRERDNKETYCAFLDILSSLRSELVSLLL